MGAAPEALGLSATSREEGGDNVCYAIKHGLEGSQDHVPYYDQHYIVSEATNSTMYTFPYPIPLQNPILTLQENRRSLPLRHQPQGRDDDCHVPREPQIRRRSQLGLHLEPPRG
jgi:hypothetical protein